MPARMSTPPRTEPTGPPLERLTESGESDEAPPRTRLELMMLGGALLFGLVLMPLLIWVVGSHVLGPYSHGQNAHAGPFALLADFFVGLGHGSAVFWSVALGPAVLLILVRLFIRALRSLPTGAPR
jgi:hypothetical protein